MLIMMLSSAGHRGDGERCKAAGVAAYLTKPVRQSVLLHAIHAALAASAGGAAVAAPRMLITRHTVREARAPLRVLLAEDNAINRALMTSLLAKRGHSVVTARDGREAMEAHARERFDVALMDISMPDIDGFEVTTAIRGREAGQGVHLPIIALTAHAMTGDRERCLAAGMDFYLTKPVRPDELDDILEAAADLSLLPPRAEPSFDPAVGLSRVRGDP